MVQFQLTRPRGARLVLLRGKGTDGVFQLTRPRGARRDDDDVGGVADGVSTHAPARGATPGLRVTPLRGTSFQLTRPRGARRRPWSRRCSARRFNSRAREGRDRITSVIHAPQDVSTHAPARGATPSSLASLRLQSVSTHAPARGATKRARCRRAGRCGFNSRAREGRDRCKAHRWLSRSQFQLTRPRGARHELEFTATFVFSRFNSRAREGRDCIMKKTTLLS